MRDNYIFSSFLGAPQSILGGIFLFIIAVVFGQGSMLLALALTRGPSWAMDSPLDFFFGLLFTYGFGALSIVGIIFYVIDFWFVYRLVCQDESAHTFFFVIALSQVGMLLSALIPMGEIAQGWFAGAIALTAVGLLYLGANKLKAKLIERMIKQNEAP